MRLHTDTPVSTNDPKESSPEGLFNLASSKYNGVLAAPISPPLIPHYKYLRLTSTSWIMPRIRSLHRKSENIIFIVVKEETVMNKMNKLEPASKCMDEPVGGED